MLMMAWQTFANMADELLISSRQLPVTSSSQLFCDSITQIILSLMHFPVSYHNCMSDIKFLEGLNTKARLPVIMGRILV